MANITVRETVRDKTAKFTVLHYLGTAGAGLSISNGDTFTVNAVRVLEVNTNKPAAITGWSYSRATGDITFTVTGGAQTGIYLSVKGQF